MLDVGFGFLIISLKCVLQISVLNLPGKAVTISRFEIHLFLHHTQPSSCFVVSCLMPLLLPVSSLLTYQVIFVFDEQV